MSKTVDAIWREKLANQVDVPQLQRDLRASRMGEFHAKRSVKASYDASKTGDSNERYWANSDKLSAIAANSAPVREILRNRTRYEAANNSVLDGMLSTLANDVIGTSIRVEFLGMEEEVAGIVSREFMAWAQSINLFRKLRLMRREKAVDGEAFGRFFRNPKGRHRVKLNIETIEADRITDPYSVEEERWEDGWNVDGKILDRYGNAVGYKVLSIHPGALYNASMFNDIGTEPAARMLHWFTAKRSGQFRGIPEVTSSLGTHAQRRQYFQSVIDAARNAAQMNLIYKTQEAPHEGANEIPDDMILDVVRNMVNFAPEGYEPYQLKAEHPMSQFNDFDRRLLGDSARNLNMPLNIAAADSSKYNYASGRLDHQLWWRTQDIDRAELETEILAKIVDMWVFEATRIEDYLPIDARLIETDWAHTWHYDSRQHVDPKKEADAQKVRLENLTTTLSEELTNSGQGWRATMDQQKIENDYAEKLGLPKPHTRVDGVTGQVIAEPEDIEVTDEDKEAEGEAANQSQPA